MSLTPTYTVVLQVASDSADSSLALVISALNLSSSYSISIISFADVDFHDLLQVLSAAKLEQYRKEGLTLRRPNLRFLHVWTTNDDGECTVLILKTHLDLIDHADSRNRFDRDTNPFRRERENTTPF